MTRPLTPSRALCPPAGHPSTPVRAGDCPTGEASAPVGAFPSPAAAAPGWRVPVTREALLDARARGLSPSALARETGWDLDTIRKAKHRHGVTLDRPASRVRAQAPEGARERACLCCRAPFLSHGPGNRLCDPCRKRDDLGGW